MEMSEIFLRVMFALAVLMLMVFGGALIGAFWAYGFNLFSTGTVLVMSKCVVGGATIAGVCSAPFAVYAVFKGEG